MNGAKWVSCCAVVLVLTVSTSAYAQVAPDDEKSVVVGDSPAEAAVGGNDFCLCIGEADSPAVARIEQALDGQLKSTGISFVDVALEEVIQQLQEEYGFPIQLDLPALDEIGIGPDEPLSVDLHNISLRSAMRLMLKKLQLTYIIQDEVLIITTPEEAETQLVTCVYDIRDLIDGPTRFDPVVDAITSCVATETWAANGGGEAEIRPLKPGLLVISQTRAVHEEVQGLLTTIRAMGHETPAPAEAAVAPTADDAEKVVTRSYLLQINPSDDVAAIRDQVRELIVQALPDAVWKGRLEDGQPVVLTVFHDRVVVRHIQAVQDEVQALLADSGIATAASPTVAGEIGGGYGIGRGGGRGGFFQPDSAEND